MDSNKIKDIFEKYFWPIIGIVIALILIMFRLVYFILCIALIIGFAFLGSCFQKNKSTIKEKIKAFIDKI